MIILINISNLKIGGGLQVAHSFINKILNIKSHVFHVVLSLELQKQINVNNFPDNFFFYYYSINPNILNSITGKNNYLCGLEKEIKPDKVFSVFAPTYWNPKTFHIAGYAKPQYIYKNSPFFNTLNIIQRLKLKIIEKIHLYNINKCCDGLISESLDVSTKLKVIFPHKKIHTVSNNYNQIFDNPELYDNTIVLPAFDGNTFLYISANYPHKNIKIIPELIIHLKENYPSFKFRFILTIDSHELNNYKKDIKQNIVFLGKIKINQCPIIYKQCDFAFIPTLLECFSATYPEAMRMKKPILTSNLDFARSLCGNAALYFDPLSVEDIALKMIELTNNNEMQNKLIENGIHQLEEFDTAEERAKKYLKIITSDETNNTRFKKRKYNPGRSSSTSDK